MTPADLAAEAGAYPDATFTTHPVRDGQGATVYHALRCAVTVPAPEGDLTVTVAASEPFEVLPTWALDVLANRARRRARAHA